MISSPQNWKTSLCTDCVNWDITNDSCGLLHFDPPEHYPSSYNVDMHNGKLIPKKLLNANLKNAVHISHEKYLNGDWTKNNFLSYLQANGLNARSREKAFEHADNCRNIMKYRMDDENNLDMIFLRRDADENPEMY